MYIVASGNLDKDISSAFERGSLTNDIGAVFGNVHKCRNDVFASRIFALRATAAFCGSILKTFMIDIFLIYTIYAT